MTAGIKPASFHYRVEFTDGSSKEIKRSRKQYAAAWLAVVTFPNGLVKKFSGFASSREKAWKNKLTHSEVVDLKPIRITL